MNIKAEIDNWYILPTRNYIVGGIIKNSDLSSLDITTSRVVGKIDDNHIVTKSGSIYKLNTPHKDVLKEEIELFLNSLAKVTAS